MVDQFIEVHKFNYTCFQIFSSFKSIKNGKGIVFSEERKQYLEKKMAESNLTSIVFFSDVLRGGRKVSYICLQLLVHDYSKHFSLRGGKDLCSLVKEHVSCE